MNYKELFSIEDQNFLTAILDDSVELVIDLVVEKSQENFQKSIIVNNENLFDKLVLEANNFANEWINNTLTSLDDVSLLDLEGANVTLPLFSNKSFYLAFDFKVETIRIFPKSEEEF